jgi:hypothetical protein
MIGQQQELVGRMETNECRYGAAPSSLSEACPKKELREKVMAQPEIVELSFVFDSGLRVPFVYR